MKRLPITVVGLALLAGSAWACQVPVFRYAFEQWSPERYKVVILAEEISEDLQAAAEATLVRGSAKQYADIEIVSVSDAENPTYSKLWNQHSEAGKPIALTYYPQKASQVGGQLAHICRASGDQLQRITDSPVRSEIAKRLSVGESAVWVLLECGDKAKDDEAHETLQQQLAMDADWLKLPTPEEMEIQPEILEQVKVKLKVEFSVIRVSQKDPQEQFLVDCLLNSEPDLRQFDEPIAFPVFGRGLVLYALVGKGIAPETIRSASSFICGPCSCQVKEQNPGFDLLMNVDWKSVVGETMISQPIPGAGTTPKLLTIPSGRAKR